MNKNIKKYIIYSNKTIRDALNVIDKNGQKTCFVLDKNQKLLGSITDGDIRRKILKNRKNIQNKVENYYNKKPIKIYDHNSNIRKIKNIFLKKKIEILPILNNNEKIIKIVLRSEIAKFNKKKIIKLNSLKKIPVVIMAGGKGQRLDPITRIFPKPLVPIKDKTAIGNIIDSFLKFGVKKFYFILNHKADLIKAFFKSKNSLFQKISFIDETKPLGTAGGLEKLKNRFKESFIVTNCDVFFNFNFNNLILNHKKNKNDLTLVVSSQTSYLPYGVCEVSQNLEFKKIKEKPKFKHLITTGLYVINPSTLQIILKNQYMDMNTLIQLAKSKNLKIGIFKISKNNWQDIGQLRDYKKNINLLSV